MAPVHNCVAGFGQISCTSVLVPALLDVLLRLQATRELLMSQVRLLQPKELAIHERSATCLVLQSSTDGRHQFFCWWTKLRWAAAMRREPCPRVMGRLPESVFNQCTPPHLCSEHGFLRPVGPPCQVATLAASAGSAAFDEPIHTECAVGFYKSALCAAFIFQWRCKLHSCLVLHPLKLLAAPVQDIAPSWHTHIRFH